MLHIWATAFWPPKYLMQHQLIILLSTLVCNQSLLSCCSQESLFIPGFQQFDYYVSWCWSFSVHLTCTSLSFLNVYIHVFHQIWEVFSHHILNILFLSSGTPTMRMLFCLMVSCRSPRPCHFPLINIFLFPSFDSFHYPILKFIDYFFFCLLKSVLSLSSRLFYFCHCILHLHNFFSS